MNDTEIPAIVGFYRISGPKEGGMRLAMYSRPHWLARKLMALLLDIHWMDA